MLQWFLIGLLISSALTGPLSFGGVFLFCLACWLLVGPGGPDN